MKRSVKQRLESLIRHYQRVAVGARAFGRGARFVFQMLADSAPRLAAALLILSLVQAAIPVFNVRLTQIIVNMLAGGGSAIRLLSPLATYLALLLAAAGLAPALNSLQALVSERLTMQVNLLALGRVNRFQELTPFEDPVVSNEIHTIGERAHHLPRNLLRGLVSIGQAVLSAAGLCGLLATLHPVIPVILLATLLPGLLVQRQNSILHFNLLQETAELERRQSYWLELGTNAASAREILLLDLAGWLRQQFSHGLEELHRRRWQLRRRLLHRTLSMLALRFTGTAGIFFYLVARGAAGSVRPGDFVLFLGSLLMLEGQLQFIPLTIGRLIEDGSLTDRFLAFLQPDDLAPGGQAKLPADALRNGLEMRHVSFRYPGRDEMTLRDVSFAIRPGETVALVGKNGAGKTTLVKLLTGLYRPSGGTIRLGGHELSGCDPASVRAAIAVVFQDYGRYCLTAGENIGLGQVERIEDQGRIIRAARDGGSEALIRGLDHGFETRLGKEFGGTQLSGGEWQKLALSRAFMRDADLLILDEPTAALDVRAEAEIYHRFQTLLGGRSGLLISHRFSTVRMADRIVVLEGGSIVEEGTHEGLLARGGLYAEMFRLQAEAFRHDEEVTP